MQFVLLVVGLAVGVAAGFLVRRYLSVSRIQGAEARAQRVVLEAEREAETKVRAALVDVKEEIASMRREAEEDVRLRRDEVVKQEERLTRGEDQLDRRQQEWVSRCGGNRAYKFQRRGNAVVEVSLWHATNQVSHDATSGKSMEESNRVGDCFPPARPESVSLQARSRLLRVSGRLT